jgi:hypothetical protein
VYFKVPELEDPMAAAARMAGVSGFKEVRVSARDESGEHRQFASQGGPPAPGSQGGQAQGQQVPNQRRREVIDPADIDPDFSPGRPDNFGVQSRAPPPQARPAAPSQSSAPLPPSNYRPVVRKEIVWTIATSIPISGERDNDELPSERRPRGRPMFDLFKGPW